MSSENNLILHIENFQAISEMDLDFEEGINIIAGQSNSSKTSVLRAIEVLLRNQSGSGRALGNWQQNAAPEIEGTFDGNANDDWLKGKSGAFYSIEIGSYGADGGAGGGKVGFKASKSSSVYGRNSTTEVRPDNIVLLACRKD